MSDQHKYDVTIIGSGPGGYVAAIRAAQLGLATAVVEMADRPGGTCLHWGCIPTKAMLHTAEVLETTRHAGDFGVKVAAGKLDLKGLDAYMKKIVDGNVKGVEYLFKKNKITLIKGRGKLAGQGKVEVTPKDGKPFLVETACTILATGTEIKGLPGVEFDGKRVINSDHALFQGRVPKSMVVLGAGAVGVEFASIYKSYGSDVTIVELLPNLVPIEDADLGKELTRNFKKRGIDVHVGTSVDKVEVGKTNVKITASKGGKKVELSAETLLVAIGRRPLTENLGLEGTGVEVDRGFIKVDSMMRTGEPGVYAIGDIVPTPALAHLASHEGIVAAEHAAGLEPHAINYDLVPSCTYCDPEVASIGLSEAEAKERGYDVAVGKFPFTAIGKAKILGDTRGFAKIVTDKKYDEVLGVHLIGPHATELLSEATAALNLEATAESLFNAIHAHPTLSEVMGEAAMAVHGRQIHL
ncbi:dihydrolipoamide dehydrogenase [Acidobacteria bacterium Mor1]|nr:dihydrolipoamide dehydrogenase [Acidobacteria bacterium Mor1]